ncbi:MAG TPA: diguanylate cyclase [Bacteroidota bacterium]|nr:diguanylate cyclase [Bacteroidota bacterium]
MNDARKRNPFFSWISSLTLMQETYVGLGVILFIASIFVHNLMWRVICIVGLGAVTVLLVRTILRQPRQESTSEDDSQQDSKERDGTVKKLIFDDFQTSGSQYKIQLIDDGNKQPLQETPNQEFHEVSHHRAPKQTTVEWDLTAFFEDIDQATQNGPRGEFHALTSRILTAVKEVTFAYTVALFWVNREKNQLVLEDAASDSSAFIQQRRLELGNDYISQVAQAGKPIIVNYLTDISQSELLPYYSQKEQVQTFLGIPVFYPAQTSTPIAVLTVDCCENDAYGNETIALLANFAKLLSSLLVSYTSKYDLLLDSKVLQALSHFRQNLEQEFSVPVICRTLAEETSKLVSWDYVAVVLHDENRKEWLVQYMLNRMNDSYVPLLSSIDLDGSIVGKVIQTGAPTHIEHLSQIGLPRFYPAERCESDGSLLAIPINSLTRCYGALVVESKDSHAYSDSDIVLVQKFTNEASWALEALSLMEITSKYISFDETTGVATRKAFMDRVHEEVQRADDFNAELSVVMVAIDRMEDHLNRFGKEAFDFILQNVGRIVKTAVRPYDVVGRFDFNCFGVILVNTTPNEASLWAEKLRKNVASNIINIDNRNFSTTVSIGIAGTFENASDMDVLGNATRALAKAREAGGNIMRVY